MDNDGDEKDKQDEYSVDEDSIEKQEDRAPPQTKSRNHHTVAERLGLQLVTAFLGNEFSLPAAEELSPMQYFKKFRSDNITKNLAIQTNIYLVQKSGKCIDANAQVIERFIGIQMLMSIVSLPSYCTGRKICVLIVLPM